MQILMMFFSVLVTVILAKQPNAYKDDDGDGDGDDDDGDGDGDGSNSSDGCALIDVIHYRTTSHCSEQ